MQKALAVHLLSEAAIFSRNSQPLCRDQLQFLGNTIVNQKVGIPTSALPLNVWYCPLYDQKISRQICSSCRLHKMQKITTKSQVWCRKIQLGIIIIVIVISLSFGIVLYMVPIFKKQKKDTYPDRLLQTMTTTNNLILNTPTIWFEACWHWRL